MANQPHDMTGKNCRICGTELARQSFAGTITKRENGMLVKYRACIKCMNHHYAAGE